VLDRARGRLAIEYEAHTWELINRATEQGNNAIVQNNKKYSGTQWRQCAECAAETEPGSQKVSSPITC
jgi:hypothetical protein